MRKIDLKSGPKSTARGHSQLNRSVRRAISAFEPLEDRMLYSMVVVNSVLDQTDHGHSTQVTLRDAVNIANHSKTPTEITFDPSLFSVAQTITLRGSALTIKTKSAADAVTITAPDAGLTINANHRSADFVIGTKTNVTLTGMTLTGGRAGTGAGVDSNGLLTLVDSTITGNTATKGGGVFNNGASHADTTLTNCTITSNTAKSGGGIYNTKGGTVVLGASEVADNIRSGKTQLGSDAVGVFSSTGLNLIGNADGSSGWTSGDVTGTTSAPESPAVDPIAGNADQPAPTELPVPIVIGPGVGDTSTASVTDSTMPTFTWNAVPSGITGFQLNLYDVTAKQFVSFQIDPSATSFTVPTALTAGDSFVWNLRIVNGDATGAPSQYLFFQTPGGTPINPVSPASLPVPVTIGPGATNASGNIVGTSTTTPTFTWNAIPSGITGFRLNLFDTTTEQSASFLISPSATSFTPTVPLAAGDTFVWNLRVVDGTVTGTESQYLFFQTPAATSPTAPLPVPTVLGPGAVNTSGSVVTIDSTTPTFTWDAVASDSGITGYQLNLFDTTSQQFVSFQIVPTATSFSLPNPLPAGHTFVWNLRVVDGAVTGMESQYLFFATPGPTTNALPVPTVIGPGAVNTSGSTPTISSTTPTFTWDAVPTGSTITGYQLNLYDITANQFVSYQVGPISTSFTPSTPLAAGDTFVWNLRVVDGSVTGTESQYLYFQTPAPASPLPVPTVIGPGATNSSSAVTVSGTSPTFSWDAVPPGSGITGYQLNLYDQTAKVFVSYQIGASATSFTVPTPLAAGDTFVWNLRVVDGTVTGGESQYLYFQTPASTAPVLPVPTILSPGAVNVSGTAIVTITTNTPTFNWNAVPAGSTITGYQLNLYDVTTAQFTSYQIGASATSFTVPSALAADDTFVWNLRVVNGTVTGGESQYFYFQTPAPSTTALPVPTILSPGAVNVSGTAIVTISTTTPTFTWDAVPTGSTITGYQLNLYNVTTSQFVSYQTSAGATSFTVPAPLPAGDTFVWNLRVVNGSVTGGESQYFYFQTPAPTTPALPVPTILGPGAVNVSGTAIVTISTTTPTFTWNAVPSGSTITGYQLNLYNVTTSQFVSYQTSAGATSFTVPSPLPAGDTFVWNLRVVNGSVTGGESQYFYFQTPAPTTPALPVPTILGPGAVNVSGTAIVTISTTTPTFTWNAVPSGSTITGYQLNLYNVTTSQFVSYQTSAGATSFTVPSPLPAGDTFVWNLRVVNGTVTGDESQYFYFQTPAPTALPVPTILGPGAVNTSGSTIITIAGETPTFTWNAVPAGSTISSASATVTESSSVRFNSVMVHSIVGIGAEE